MAKDLYEENKELKRVLYNIEKAILDFRLTQLDLPLEKVNIPSLGLPQPVSYTCSCNNGEGCSCDEEKEVLREQIAALTAKLNGANAELEQYKRKEVTEDVAPTGFPGDSVADEEDEVIYENGFATYAEPAPPREEEEKKTRKPRKERGGTVFTDFKNLELENNDYEGNSIIYSKKDM